MVVIAIVAIVLSIGALNFREMKGKADTEKQTKELHSDITGIRLNAIQNKQISALMLGPKQYVYRIYSSINESVSAGTEVKTVSYSFEIKKKTGSTLNSLDSAVDWIKFDSRGYAYTNDTNPPDTITLVVLPVTYGSGLNCIEVQKARTSIGRMVDASTCQKQ